MGQGHVGPIHAQLTRAINIPVASPLPQHHAEETGRALFHTELVSCDDEATPSVDCQASRLDLSNTWLFCLCSDYDGPLCGLARVILHSLP